MSSIVAILLLMVKGDKVIIMIKIAFCDDDLSALNEIKVLLDQYRAEHKREIVYAVFCSPFELLAEIEKGMRWDILILDILMPGENGINVAKEIRRYDGAAKIIFLTSSSDFAVESYTVGAYFYQTKPVSKEKFFRLLDSVIFDCERAQQCSLVLRCKSGITRINLEKLEYCEVTGRTLAFHLVNGKVLESSGSLDELCEKLGQYECFVHSWSIWNIFKIYPIRRLRWTALQRFRFRMENVLKSKDDTLHMNFATKRSSYYEDCLSA